MTLPLEPAAFFAKQEVIASMGITASHFSYYSKLGIIPPPDGRDGNAHRWNSNIINAIAATRKIIGEEYSFDHTLGIMLKRLEIFERNIKNRP